MSGCTMKNTVPLPFDTRGHRRVSSAPHSRKRTSASGYIRLATSVRAVGEK